MHTITRIFIYTTHIYCTSTNGVKVCRLYIHTRYIITVNSVSSYDDISLFFTYFFLIISSIVIIIREKAKK